MLRKTTLIFLLVLIGLLSSVSAVINDTFGYYRELTYSPTNHTSQPILINLTDICGGNCLANYCDVRIFNSTEDEIPFQIDDIDNDNDPDFIHFIYHDTSTTYYIYYGNAGATCSNTTLFWDFVGWNFEDGDISEWTDSGSELSITDNPFEGRNSLLYKFASNTGTTERAIKTFGGAYPYYITFALNFSAAGILLPCLGTDGSAGSNAVTTWLDYASNQIKVYNPTTVMATVTDQHEWHIFKWEIGGLDNTTWSINNGAESELGNRGSPADLDAFFIYPDSGGWVNIDSLRVSQTDHKQYQNIGSSSLGAETPVTSGATPTVTHITPANNSYTTDNTPTLTFNFTDDNFTTSCTILVNNTKYGTNAAVSNNTNTGIAANASISDGVYYWNVTCDDGGDVGNSTPSWLMGIDTVTPVVAFQGQTPANNSVGITNSAFINVTVTETNLKNCTLEVGVDGGFTNYTMFMNSTIGECTYNFTTADGKAYTFEVYANDTVAHLGTTGQLNYIENAGPTTPTISSPTEQQQITLTEVTFTYSSTDALGGTNITYYVIINGTLNFTDTTGSKAVDGFTNGTHYGVQVVAWDGYENSTTSVQRNFSINISTSLITLSSPYENYTTTSQDINFTFNATSGNNLINCSVYLDGVINQTSSVGCYQEYSNVSTSCGGVDTGYYKWDAVTWVTKENMSDGDWDTASYTTDPSGYFYINYTKPTAATGGSWKVKDGSGTYYLPIPKVCWDYSATILNLIVLADRVPNRIVWSCDNGSASYMVLDENGGTDPSVVYEEAIIWNETSTVETYEVTNITEGWHNWSIQCYDSSTNFNSSTRRFAVDLSKPGIADNFVNNSVYYDTNITAKFNISDNIILFSFNITIDGVAIFNISNINETTYQYNLSYDPTLLSGGKHILNLTATDGHTAERLMDATAYNPKASYYVKYQMRKPYPNTDIEIYIKGKDRGDKWTVEKQDDRYIEKVRPATKASKITFVVKASEKIYIIEDKKGRYFGKWLIIGDHWKDFYLPNEPTAFIEKIKRISDYEVEVTLDGITNTEELVFSSTGDLNRFSMDYVFYTIELNFTYSGNKTMDSSNYVRNLTYDINYLCSNETQTNLKRLLDGTLNRTDSITCDDTPRVLSSNYSHAAIGTYNISFYFNTTLITDTFADDEIFISDLEDPVIEELEMNFTEGFVSAFANITFNCTDDVMTNFTYNLTFNNISLEYDNLSNSTRLDNYTAMVDGSNILEGACSDLFGTTYSSVTHTVNVKTFSLINEKTGAALDITNLSSVIIYFDNNHTQYDFKANSTTFVNFTAIDMNKTRLELIYGDDSIVTRYIDVSLTPDDDVRVCGNLDDVQHYEQLITAASQKEAIMKSVYADCFVVADYTRFAYQDGYVLKAYTIETMYYLYTFDEDGVQIILASVDGSIQTYIDLDTIEFTQEGYNIGILNDALSFQKVGETTIQIYYDNIGNANTELSINITRMDTSTIVFSSSTFADMDTVTILFDYSTLSNVTNTTLFRIDVGATKANDYVHHREFFNIFAKTGAIAAGLAFILSFILLFGGLTFTVTRTTFSWFGIIIILSAIGILTFAVSNWYIIFLMAIEIIAFVYVVLVMINQTYPTVS